MRRVLLSRWLNRIKWQTNDWAVVCCRYSRQCSANYSELEKNIKDLTLVVHYFRNLQSVLRRSTALYRGTLSLKFVTHLLLGDISGIRFSELVCIITMKAHTSDPDLRWKKMCVFLFHVCLQFMDFDALKNHAVSKEQSNLEIRVRIIKS